MASAPYCNSGHTWVTVFGRFNEQGWVDGQVISHIAWVNTP